MQAVRVHAPVILIACYLAILPSVSTADDTRHPSLSPAQDFSNSMFILLTPNSKGWVGLSRSPATISFGRVGSSRTDSDVAAVTLFSIPEGLSPEGFLAHAKDGLERDAPAPRFEVKESLIRLSQARSYPCVEYDATSIDHGKQLLFLPRKDLLLRLIALYCQYPNKPGLGFSISFSHRGTELPPNFDAEAQDFIAGVEVTSPPARPNQHLERP
jgi:hypothetical protein